MAEQQNLGNPYIGEVKIGDRVRSWDFPDRSRNPENQDACYVTGVVIAIVKMGERFNNVSPARASCDMLRIRVSQRIWRGKVDKIGITPEVVCAPQNGIPRMFDTGVTNGVEVLA